ncbi:AEC family transporter [Niveibacterium sp.]|uniref:AEC family transporter n=1 Tax=Niveibacterium sp. TaxID=2017444 RepID=UPI0035AE02B6
MDGIRLLAPDFALILLGVALRRLAGLPSAFWSGLEQLIYFVLFPALLFSALVRNPIEAGAALPLFGAGLGTMAFGVVLSVLFARLGQHTPLEAVSRAQCGFRFNTYIGLAAAGSALGQPGLATMGLLCGMTVPFANAASVVLLARHAQARLLPELVRNPLILATLAGLACNLLGWHPPAAADAALSRLAQASVPMGLLAVGAALRFKGTRVSPVPAAAVLAVKLAALPLIAWFAAQLFGLSGTPRAVLVLWAGLPSASSAYILAVRLGGDAAGVAWLISVSTLIAMLSLPLLLALAA